MNHNRDVAVLSEQVRQLNENLKYLKSDMEGLRRDISEVHEMANRWKGGLIVVVGLGGVVGWLLSVGSNISKLWTH